jgi:hypothetical protein
MDTLAFLKLDKTALSAVPLTGDSDERKYWHAQSPDVRVRAVETLRQLNYGIRRSSARLSRVLEVAQRASA